MNATRVWCVPDTCTMFRLVSLVCRRWQRIRPSCFVQQQLHRRLEPIVRSNGTLITTSDTAGSPDVEIHHDQQLRRTFEGDQKITSSDMTEMYRTRRRIMDRFYRLMKTCELVMVVTKIFFCRSSLIACFSDVRDLKSTRLANKNSL